MDNVILIGFMGCGKTSVGIKLSYHLKCTMVDTDRMIERRQERTVNEIFDEDGEQAFREMETECLRFLFKTNVFQIISTGGGLPLRQENRKLLRQLGAVIYLRVTPETVYERLREDETRPLLQAPEPERKIRELLDQRKAVYEQASDYIVDVDGKSVESIMKEITRLTGKGEYGDETISD